MYIRTLITGMDLLTMKRYEHEQANRWIRRQAFHHGSMRSYRDV